MSKAKTRKDIKASNVAAKLTTVVENSFRQHRRRKTEPLVSALTYIVKSLQRLDRDVHELSTATHYNSHDPLRELDLFVFLEDQDDRIRDGIRAVVARHKKDEEDFLFSNQKAVHEATKILRKVLKSLIPPNKPLDPETIAYICEENSLDAFLKAHIEI